MSRIQITDTATSMVTKMCEGNPGALRVLCECLKEGAAIDPEGMPGGIGPILSMDTLKLYGSRIWMLYADVCSHDLRRTIALLRAWQLGLVSAVELDHAIDSYGDGINVPQLVAQVEELLPRFQREQVEADKSPV
jgi:hypothetical protein